MNDLGDARPGLSVDGSRRDRAPSWPLRSAMRAWRARLAFRFQADLR